PSRARTRQGRRAFEVFMLRSIVRGDCTYVGDVLDEALQRIVICEHPIAIALCQLRDISIHAWERFRRHLLDLISNGRVASNDIEIMAVELKTTPHELSQRLNFIVVCRAYYRIRV